jgi:sugar phosphate isomerase/epimerase
MSGIGIESSSVFGLPPVEFVNLAADLGCDSISATLALRANNPLPYPAWSLRENPALRRNMKAAMRDRGIALALADATAIRPGAEIRDYASDLDLFADLGAERVGTVSFEPDLGRTYDQLALLVDMAQERGFKATVLEFVPGLAIPTLSAGLAALRHVGKPSLQLLADAMHLYRSGGTAADLVGLSAGLIGYAQICDYPLRPADDDYFEQATTERLVPGAGEIPLREFLLALPKDIPLGLEVPMLAAAKAGKSAHERLRPCVGALRGLLESP